MRWSRTLARASALCMALGAAVASHAMDHPFGAVSVSDLRAARSSGVPGLEGAPVRAPALPRSEVAARAKPFARLSSRVYEGEGEESCWSAPTSCACAARPCTCSPRGAA